MVFPTTARPTSSNQFLTIVTSQTLDDRLLATAAEQLSTTIIRIQQTFGNRFSNYCFLSTTEDQLLSTIFWQPLSIDQ